MKSAMIWEQGFQTPFRGTCLPEAHKPDLNAQLLGSPSPQVPVQCTEICIHWPVRRPVSFGSSDAREHECEWRNKLAACIPW
jgi:hypothetical protein